jgi:hypothetical protein
MTHIKSVSPKLIRGYVEGKEAYKQVFPAIYYKIAKRVEDMLGETHPQLESVVGPDDKEALMAKFPEKGEDVPLDWVAFGFYGIDMYHYHIGVLVDVQEWPITWVVGLHVMDRYLSDDELELVLPRIEKIKWMSEMGRQPNYVYAESVCEHRWLDPIRELDVAQIDPSVTYIAERVSEYYEAAAPAAALLSQARS